MGSNKATKKFVYVTLLSAMAIAINLVESAFVAGMPFGIRFGFANIIAIITIELFSAKEMITVNLMRVLIGNLIRGTIFGSTFWISAGGVFLSTIVLILVKKVMSMENYGSSMLCAVAHSVGQVLVVMFIYKQTAMITIIPILLISSIPTGILTGWIAKEALKRLDKDKLMR